jgi:ABC-type uncharacterized transport system YnjBCD substrate-binding protein
LSLIQKLDQATLSRKLLFVLHHQQQRSWHDIVTFDESWFYFNTDHELIWLQGDGEIPEMERQTIQSGKVMLTIVWTQSGFHLINVFPKDSNFNASYYIT